MKKTKTVFFLPLFFYFLTFCGCDGDASKGWGPIFYNVCQEVTLDSAVVTGNIWSMVETSNNMIFCTNGYLWYKNVKDADGNYVVRSWEKLDTKLLPSDTGATNSLVRLASDDKYLYVKQYDALKNTARYFCADYAASEFVWNELQVNIPQGYVIREIFDNDATCGIGARHVYISVENTNNYSQYKIYKINDGGSSTTEISSNVLTWITDDTKFTAQNSKAPVKASWISSGDVTVFSNDMLLCSNRTNCFYHVADGSNRSDKVIAFSKDGTQWDESIKPDLAKNLYYTANCYKDTSGSSFLYLAKRGNTNGILVVRLNDNTGEPTTTTVNSPIGSNYSSCLGDMNAIGIYPYPFGSGILYIPGVVYLSTKASSNTNKLWGYYPTRPGGQQNIWNNE